MKTQRKPSVALTEIVNSIDGDKLRRTKERMLVAAKIADALNVKGISQRRFAEMIGRSKSEISAWLSGDRNFTLDTLSDIEACLGIELLNVSSIRTARVSKDSSRIKVKKSNVRAVYKRNESFGCEITAVAGTDNQ